MTRSPISPQTISRGGKERNLIDGPSAFFTDRLCQPLVFCSSEESLIRERRTRNDASEVKNRYLEKPTADAATYYDRSSY